MWGKVFLWDWCQTALPGCGRRVGLKRWGGMVAGKLYEAGEFLSVHEYEHVRRWADGIAERPAVKRGQMVNRVNGDPAGQLRERHAASDFENRTQDRLEG